MKVIRKLFTPGFLLSSKKSSLKIQPGSLTRNWGGLSLVVDSPCLIADFFDAKNKDQVRAIWDTGASNSVISSRFAKQLNLKPTGVTKVNGVNGEHESSQYLVSIGLENGVNFSPVVVTEGEFVGFDVLIGMDIITTGSFAITNKNGKTTMSFSHPSLDRIDFVRQYPARKKFNPK